MYHAVKSQKIKKLSAIEGPSLFIAIVIANTFYKFGSFLIELLAFLPTWFVVSYLISKLGERLQPDEGA